MKNYDAEIKALQTKLKELKAKKKKGASRTLKNTILPAARKAGLANLDLDPVVLEKAFVELVARFTLETSAEPETVETAEAGPSLEPPSQSSTAGSTGDEHKPFWKR